jgi:DNA replication protein DnaC
LEEYTGICFDDLGTEDTEKAHYGNRTNVMEKIILNRYDHCRNKLTHFTTNLTAEQIKETYGLRVTDRLREMVNVLDFPTGTKSFRK